jgi:hypothetical protein
MWSNTELNTNFFTASSVINGNDGLGIECWRGEGMVFEIFWSEDALRFEVKVFEEAVPLELLDDATPIARNSLGEFAPYKPSLPLRGSLQNGCAG